MNTQVQGLSFNSATVAPATGGGGQFPEGSHLVVITGSETKPTKGNDGGMLIFECQIIQGPHQGVKAPYRLNLWNASPQAVQIAYAQLSALCHVTGVPAIETDVSPLFGKPFVVVVNKQVADPKYTQIDKVQYPDGTDVQAGKYWQHGQQQAAAGFQQPAQQQQPQQPQQPAQQAAPAWNGQQAAQQPAQQPQQPAQGQAPAWQPQPGQQPAAPAQGGAPAWQQPAQGQQAAPAGGQQQPPAWQPQGGAAAAPAWNQPR